MTETTTFETFSPEQIKDDPLFKAEEKKPDEVWSKNIATVAVGGGFRVHRTEGESVRQLKRRINAASGSPQAGFKTLEWKPESRNLPDGLPASYMVRVKAVNLTEKAAYEKAQSEATSKNGQDASNPSQEGQQTNEPQNNAQEGTQNEPSQIRGRRS